MTTEFAGNQKVALYGALAVAASSAVIWTMSSAADRGAKPWLIIAWVVIAAVLTASWISPGILPRAASMLMLAASVVVPVIAWLLGVQEGLLVAPYGALVLGWLAQSFTPRQQTMAPAARRG